MISSENYKPTKPKTDDKREVEFLFYTQIYPIAKGGGKDYSGKPKPQKNRGFKTLKLFRAWFRMMYNHGQLVKGMIRFTDNEESWFWSIETGWKRTH